MTLVIVIFFCLQSFVVSYTLPNPIPPTWWWVWIEGSEGVDVTSYGIVDDKSSTTQPGSRGYCAFWHLESENKIYLFGGSSSKGIHFDLWEKQISVVGNGFTEYEWTVRTSEYEKVDQYNNKNSEPGSRYGATSWVVETKLWLFGGFGYPQSGTSRYPKNTPWMDSDGGKRYLRDKGHLRDLWEYDTVGTSWTYKGGTFDVDQPGAAAFPGGRVGAIGGVVDATNAMYLYGGFGLCNSTTIDNQLAFSYCNDRWKYSAGVWSQIAGWEYDNTQLEPSSTHPGARAGGQMFVLKNKLYLFGGSNGMDQNSIFASSDYTGSWGFYPISDITTSKLGKYDKKSEWTTTDANPMGRRDFGQASILQSQYDEFYFFSGGTIYGAAKDLWKARLNGTFGWYLMTGNAYENALHGSYYKSKKGNFNKWSNPPQRRGHASFALDDKYFLIYGGYSEEEQGYKNDMWYTTDISRLEIFYCSGLSMYDSAQCGGHGSCLGNEYCSCDTGYDASGGQCVSPKSEEDENKKSDSYKAASWIAGIMSGLNLLYCILLCCCIHCVISIRMIVFSVIEIYSGGKKKRKRILAEEDAHEFRERFYSKRLPIPMERRRGRNFNKLREKYVKRGYDFDRVIKNFKPYYEERSEDEEIDVRKRMNEHGVYKHQEQALFLYTKDETLKEVNLDLMKDKIKKHEAIITALDFGLFHNTNKSKKKVVYRAMDLSEDEADMYIVGNRFFWKGYVSASEKSRKSKMFKGFCFYIDISDCNQHMCLEEYSDFPIEKEVILPCYFEFEVTERTEKEIHIKILPNEKENDMFGDFGEVDIEEEEGEGEEQDKKEEEDEDEEQDYQDYGDTKDDDDDEVEEEESRSKRRHRHHRKKKKSGGSGRPALPDHPKRQKKDDRSKRSELPVRPSKKSSSSRRRKRESDDDDDEEEEGDGVVGRTVFFKKEKKGRRRKERRHEYKHDDETPKRESSTDETDESN